MCVDFCLFTKSLQLVNFEDTKIGYTLNCIKKIIKEIKIMKIKTKMLKKIVAVLCAATMVASGAVVSVGAVDDAEINVICEKANGLDAKINQLREQIKEIEKRREKLIRNLDKQIKKDEEFMKELLEEIAKTGESKAVQWQRMETGIRRNNKIKQEVINNSNAEILRLNNEIKKAEEEKTELEKQVYNLFEQAEKERQQKLEKQEKKEENEIIIEEKKEQEKELKQRCENKFQELEDVRKKIRELFKLKKGDNFAKAQIKALGICLNLYKKLQNNFTVDAAKRMIEEADKVINEVNERIDKNKAEQDKKKLEEDMEKLEKEEERQAALQRYAVEEIDKEEPEDKKKFEESQKAASQYYALEDIDEDEKSIITALQGNINKSAGELREAEKEFVKFTNSKNLTFANNEKVKEVTKALYKCYELEKRLKNECVAYRAKKFFDLKKEALKLIDELKKEYGEPLKEIEKIPAEYNEALKEI